MPVVSNTSPVLNLAIIGQLGLLREQFGEIWIPPAVLKELRPEEDIPGSSAVQEAREAGWLRVEEVKDQPLVWVLRRDLDEGEAEAIALALQVKAEWILLDQRGAMTVEYAPVRDLLYLAFEPGAKAAKTVTVTPGVHADFDAKGKLVGLEVLDSSEVMRGKMQFEVELVAQPTQVTPHQPTR